MTDILSRYRELKPLQKAALWLVAAVALYAFLGFVIAPVALKAVLERKLPETLHRQVAIERIRLNPFALSARVEGFRVASRQGEGGFVSFDSFAVNLQSLSLFKKALIVKSVALSRPVVAFSRLDDGTFSFSDLLAPTTAEEPPQGEEGRFLFSINNIEIIDGAARYQDHPKGVNHEVSALTLAIPSISNLSSNIEATVQPVFSAVVNGTPLSLAGGSKPFAESRATNVDLKMSGINIPAYLAYIPNPTGLTVASALLDIDTRLFFRAGAESRLALTGTVGLREVEVTDRDGRRYLRLPAVTVALADSNLLEREVRLEEIVIEAPQAEMERLADGQILPLALLAAASDPAATEEEEEAKLEAAPAESGASALRLSVGRLRLEDGSFTFRDRATEKPATFEIRHLALVAEELSTAPGTSGNFRFSLGLNEKGSVNGEGSLMLEPLSLHSSVRIASLALNDFQPYISERLNVLLAAGDFSLAGDLQVRDHDGIAATFSGEGAVTGLAAADALTGDDLLQWKDLQVKKITFASSPPALSIDEIRLREPSVTVRIDEKGTLNLAALVRSDRQGAGTEPPAAATEAEEEAEVTIARIAIENGKALFQDRSIRPAYGAHLRELRGAVTGLTSRPGELAEVRFDARLDQAPLVLSGRINPLVEEPFIDLTLDFKNFDLSPLSPYSGRYIGNKVAKGKLNLDLNYRIRGSRLASSNDVFLDQFTLGETVDSPDATSLPVGLAIALLQNRKGEIRLDIPVQGDLSDPEFSVGGVVLQVLVNLVTKAATSPFALLGSLIPAGEDLQHVPFAPGSAALSDEAAQKLALVADVLHERPGLRMDIAGHADAQVDARALAEERLRKLVQLEKLRASGAGKAQGAEAGNVSVGAEEYPRYLRQVYERMLQTASAAGGALPQPAEPAGSEGELERMEAYLLSTLVGGEEDLRLLAIERANAVLGGLAASGRVEAGRLFVIEPDAGAAGGESRTFAELLIK